MSAAAAATIAANFSSGRDCGRARAIDSPGIFLLPHPNRLYAAVKAIAWRASWSGLLRETGGARDLGSLLDFGVEKARQTLRRARRCGIDACCGECRRDVWRRQRFGCGARKLVDGLAWGACGC